MVESGPPSAAQVRRLVDLGLTPLHATRIGSAYGADRMIDLLVHDGARVRTLLGLPVPAAPPGEDPVGWDAFRVACARDER